MKAFVVLALVALASARVVDVDPMRLLTKEKPFLHKEDLLLKEKDMMVPNIHRFNVPRNELTNVRGYYDDTSFFDRQVTVVPLDELVYYPLFREYYRIPLFRQFWEEYPVVFRRYVESPFFQQYWTMPEFQNYFRNPVLFYKYIYPQIQVISERVLPTFERYNMDVEEYYKRPVYTSGERVGDYWSRFFGRNVDMVHPYEVVEPFGHHYNREINVRDFWNRIFRRDVDYPTYPTVGQYYPTTKYEWYNPMTFGRHQYNNELSTKYLMDKIYRHLYPTSIRPNVVGDVTEVVTDVKMAPIRKEVVEPITGETRIITEPKVVDVKVDERVVPETELHHTYETETERVIKEHLLKRLWVSKYINYDMYKVLRTLPLYHVREIIRRIDPTVVVDPMYKRIDEYRFPTTHRRFVDINDVDVVERPEVRERVNQILRRLYTDDIVGDRYTPVIRDLMKVFRPREHIVPTVEDVMRPIVY